MKQYRFSFWMSVIMISLFSLVSCKGGILDNSTSIAPSNMAGKTLKVDGVTIQFTSNTSGTISDYIGTSTRSSVSYKRTSSMEAKLSFSYHTEDNYSMSERSYSLTLVFADETQGLASGSYTYSNIISKGTKYENKSSGNQNVKNKIFTVN